MAEGKSQLQEAPPPSYDEVAQMQPGYPMQNYPPKDPLQSGYPPQPEYPPQPGYPPQGYPPEGALPPSYHHQGYPQPTYPVQGYPPQGYPPQGYSQQVSQNNVVVVGQPAIVPPTRVHIQQPSKANDFLACTVVLMIVCCFHGNILSVLLTIPALFCAIIAYEYNSSGKYSVAKRCGYMALGCNISVIVLYAIEVITVIIVISVAVAGGLSCSTRYTCGFYGYSGGYVCTYRCV